jgi:hypothetical protein
MGRKAPRKRLTRRVMACPTGAAAPERLSALRPPLDPGWRSKDARTRAQKLRRGNEEDWLFDIVIWTKTHARPHPEERACEMVPSTRTRVRASRRMRTAAVWPSCFETHRSAARLRKELRSRRAALLLSMRAGEGAHFGETKPTPGWVLGPSEEPTCGCRKRAPTRVPCFRPVLYREPHNSNVYTGIARTNCQPARRRLIPSRRRWRAAPPPRAPARAA